jgi:hypothetical protein
MRRATADSGRLRRRLIGVAVSAAAVAGAGAALAPAASAADAHPCGPAVTKSWSTKGPVQPCPLTSPEPNGRIPVYAKPVPRAAGAALPAPQGWLHGTAGQYFACQTNFPAARFQHARGWRNTWWAYTMADSGIGWGWVPQVYFRGGDNDEADRGLRSCSSSAPPPGQPTPPAPQPEAARCGSSGGFEQVRIEDNQRVRISATGTDHRFRETSSTPPRRYTYLKQRQSAGSVTLHLATCKRRGKPWTLLRAGSESIRVDHPMRLDRLPDNRLWLGFAVRRIEQRRRALRGKTDEVGRVQVEGILCRHRGGNSLLKAIAGFPLPGASYAVGLGQWIAGSLWPDSDEIRCEKLGNSWSALYVNKRTGRLSADGFFTSGTMSREPESQDGFYVVRQATVTAD